MQSFLCSVFNCFSWLFNSFSHFHMLVFCVEFFFLFLSWLIISWNCFIVCCSSVWGCGNWHFSLSCLLFSFQRKFSWSQSFIFSIEFRYEISTVFVSPVATEVEFDFSMFLLLLCNNFSMFLLCNIRLYLNIFPQLISEHLTNNLRRFRVFILHSATKIFSCSLCGIPF